MCRKNAHGVIALTIKFFDGVYGRVKGTVSYKGMIKFLCENNEEIKGGYLGAALE